MFMTFDKTTKRKVVPNSIIKEVIYYRVSIASCSSYGCGLGDSAAQTDQATLHSRYPYILFLSAKSILPYSVSRLVAM